MLEVYVPATSANIGPGYDCLGLCLDLFNKFTFEELESIQNNIDRTNISLYMNYHHLFMTELNQRKSQKV